MFTYQCQMIAVVLLLTIALKPKKVSQKLRHNSRRDCIYNGATLNCTIKLSLNYCLFVARAYSVSAFMP